MPLRLRLLVRLDGDHLALSTVDGLEHSRVGIEDVDPIDALQRLEAGGACDDTVRTLWSLDQLDAALARCGYLRTSPWRPAPPQDDGTLPGGPSTEVTCQARPRALGARGVPWAEPLW